MKLRKKFSMAGAVSFFLFIASVILMMTSKRSDTVGLFRLFAAIFLIASGVLSLTGLIIKKLHRRKRRHRTHSREGRAEMAPYTEEKPLEKPTEEEETEEEASEEEEHVYQVYTMVPKTPKSKKRRKSTFQKMTENNLRLFVIFLIF